MQSARDKAVEIYKSFKNVKKKGSHLHLRKCCIRFYARSFTFVKANRSRGRESCRCRGYSERQPEQTPKGEFRKGTEIKALKGIYHHILRSLGRKKCSHEIKKLKGKLSRKTDQLLHQLTNEIVDYATQFEKPLIDLEELTHIRNQFQKNQKGKRLNRRMKSLPFRKLQTYIEYKALKQGIAVKCIDPTHTSKLPSVWHYH
ncbi:MAG: IS200/IS605 family element transposase accessory protein TnpB|nr:IS200/IS605 family element transposase accessory protein TnpB [Candidatus Lokiarchaeota archaeon]MBD3202069.1 IS200/IS605 family element transposase accessory protein TnpB [Candidatus Lokiarchaeota archaeon]